MSDRYYKVPVDLNEGAGGDWIYLYYSKSEEESGITNILFDQSKRWMPRPNITWEYPGYKWVRKTFSGLWNDDIADLNEGCGGERIDMAIKKGTGSSVIKDFIIVSSTYPLNYNSVDGWYLITGQDLNATVGGKYIYMGFNYSYVADLIRRIHGTM